MTRTSDPSNWGRRGCDACAILRVESVIVLDPGVGYGLGDDPIVPIVEIEHPKRLKKKGEPQQQQGKFKGKGSEAGTAPEIEIRTAVAVADIEYEIVGARLVDGGNGDDPDW